MKCPDCGAGIKRIDQMNCDYCGNLLPQPSPEPQIIYLQQEIRNEFSFSERQEYIDLQLQREEEHSSRGLTGVIDDARDAFRLFQKARPEK